MPKVLPELGVKPDSHQGNAPRMNFDFRPDLILGAGADFSGLASPLACGFRGLAAPIASHRPAGARARSGCNDLGARARSGCNAGGTRSGDERSCLPG